MATNYCPLCSVKLVERWRAFREIHLTCLEQYVGAIGSFSGKPGRVIFISAGITRLIPHWASWGADRVGADFPHRRFVRCEFE